jgi:hypothetical protein
VLMLGFTTLIPFYIMIFEDGQNLELGHSTSDNGKPSVERSHANNVLMSEVECPNSEF